jgi:hypothetical protein
MLKLGRAQGVSMAAALYRNIPITEYSPKKIKQSIPGNGNASKEQVAAMLQQLLKFKNGVVDSAITNNQIQFVKSWSNMYEDVILYELFEGNKAEVRTLLTSIEEWKKCFAIGDVCFVGDRAMFSKENLNQLNAKNYKYVISCPLRKLGQNIQAELLNEDNYKVQYYDQEIVWLGEFKYEENNRRKKPSLLDEEEIPHEQRLIVTYSSKRARKDAKDRQRIIDKIKKYL